MFKKSLFKRNLDGGIDGDVNRIKFIQERIKMAEKYIPELGKALFNYIDKTAKSRDCIDKIAIVLNDYAKVENVTGTFKLQMGEFANVLLDVGSKQDSQVQVMESKVLEQLSEYEKLCSQVQSQLKVSIMASDKKRNWTKQLKRLRGSHPQDQEQVSLAETEFIKARGESARSSRNLEEQIDIFEKKRLNSMREALLAWTLAELHFHAKALQLFTDAYRIAADLNVNEDLEEFRNKLKSVDETPRSDVTQRSDSVLRLLSLPFGQITKFTGNGIPHPCPAQTSARSSQLNIFQEDK